MSEDNVVKLPDPPKPPEWIVGPFKEWRVVVHGRFIPWLTAVPTPDGDESMVHLSLDNRFGLTIPKEYAYQVAAFVANALAIASGYPWSGAETKEQPFASPAMAIASPDNPAS